MIKRETLLSALDLAIDIVEDRKWDKWDPDQYKDWRDAQDILMNEYLVEYACPGCGSVHINLNGTDILEDYVYQKMVCYKCDAEWTEVFLLIGIEE